MQELEQQLTAGVEQLSASEAHITELTRDLEDATRYETFVRETGTQLIHKATTGRTRTS